MKIVFVRHGDPDYENDTLTAAGLREAQLLVPRIKNMTVRDFYCSPLGRAKDTAAPCMRAVNRTATVLDWLEEFPAYVIDPNTGRKRIPWDLMPSYWTPNPDFYDSKKWINTPIMQSGNVPQKYPEVTAKLDAFLASLGYVREGNIYRVQKANNDTIVFFCHFGITCVLLSHILGISPLVLWQGFVAAPTSITEIATEEREKGIAYFRCNKFGDISHLYAANQAPTLSARYCETFDNKDEKH